MNNSLKKPYILSFPAISTQNGQPAGIPRMQPGRNRQKGSVLLVGGIILSVTLVLAGVVIDLTRYKLVQAELQNAADAAALAGAGCLVSIGDAGTVCGNTGTAFPDFVNAEKRSENALKNLDNRSENKTLYVSKITAGYLDYKGDNNIIPPDNKASYKINYPNSVLIPVVRVSLKREGTTNGGAMETYFLKIAGISSIPAAATATAGRYNLSAPKKIIPFVVNSCHFDKLSAAGTPFFISSKDGHPDCDGYSGTWSTVTVNKNGTQAIRNEINYIIQNGARAPVSLNVTEIYVKPGAVADLYDDLNNCISNPPKACEYGILLMIPREHTIGTGLQDSVAVKQSCVKFISSSKQDKNIKVQVAPPADQHHCESIADNNGSGPGDAGTTSEISSSRLF